MLYKSLVIKISIPPEKKTKQKEYLEIGLLPIVDQGKEIIGGYTNEVEKNIVCNLPVIVFGDHTCSVKYINFPFGAGADGIKILKAKDNVLPQYLFYGTQYLVFHLHDRGYARHYQHIEKMDLYVPPIEEQRRIVSRIEELFSELDSAVETLQKTRQQLEIYRQAVLKEAFEGKLTASWRSENTVVSISSIYKAIKEKNNYRSTDSDCSMKLPMLPENWMWIYIGDITNGTEYGTSKKSEKNGKVPVIRMGNIQNGIIDWSDLVYSSDDEEINRYLLSKNDVLFNRTNSPELVGKTAIYSSDRQAIFAGYLIRINQFDIINAKYLTYYMNSYIAKNYGNIVKTDGVNQSNINSKKLCSYPFPLCTPKEQERVVYELESRLSLCTNIERTVDEALQQAEAMRQSILKKAFEGEL